MPQNATCSYHGCVKPPETLENCVGTPDAGPDGTDDLYVLDDVEIDGNIYVGTSDNLFTSTYSGAPVVSILDSSPQARLSISDDGAGAIDLFDVSLVDGASGNIFTIKGTAGASYGRVGIDNVNPLADLTFYSNHLILI